MTSGNESSKSESKMSKKSHGTESSANRKPHVVLCKRTKHSLAIATSQSENQRLSNVEATVNISGNRCDSVDGKSASRPTSMTSKIAENTTQNTLSKAPTKAIFGKPLQPPPPLLQRPSCAIPFQPKPTIEKSRLTTHKIAPSTPHRPRQASLEQAQSTALSATNRRFSYPLGSPPAVLARRDNIVSTPSYKKQRQLPGDVAVAEPASGSSRVSEELATKKCNLTEDEEAFVEATFQLSRGSASEQNRGEGSSEQNVAGEVKQQDIPSSTRQRSASTPEERIKFMFNALPPPPSRLPKKN